MKNNEVIKEFLRGNIASTPLRDIVGYNYMIYKGKTLQTDGEKLINYNTVIAYKQNNKLYINANKYSTTTSKIQSQLRFLADNYYQNADIIEYTIIDKENLL